MGTPVSDLRGEADRLRSEYLQRIATWSTDQTMAADFFKIRLEGAAAMADFSTRFSPTLSPEEKALRDASKANSDLASRMCDLGARIFDTGPSSLPDAMKNLIQQLVAVHIAAENEAEAC